MAKDKITEYDSTANNNTVCGDVNIAENSALPSDMNNFAREIMSHLKEGLGSGTPLYVDQTNNRVGINKTPTVALDVSGSLSVDGGTIKLDGNYPVGAGNVALGEGALTNTTSNNNTAVGQFALTDNVSGTLNCSFGILTLGDNTSGSSNTAYGMNALRLNTTGSFNTAVGHLSGYSNTTASNNTAVGYQALTTSTTASENNAFGKGSLQNATTGGDNSAFGVHTLHANTTGSANVAMGHYALDANTTGANNVGIGSGALGDNTTGGNNICIGSLAGEEITTADDTIGIGYRSAGGGASGATTGHDNICIGTDAGEVLTTGNKNCFIGKDSGNVYTTGYNNICIGHNSDGSAVDRYLEYVIGINCVSVGYDGIITIGVDNGSDRIYNNFKSNATWTRVSDERYKKDITDNTDCGLDFINDLRPRTFKWKPLADIDNTLPDYDPAKTTHSYPNKHYGLIAQEVKATLEAHNITDFGGHDVIQDSGIQAISEEMFVHPLIKAVQELSAKIDALEARIATLEGA